MTALDVLGGICLVAGSALILIAAVGVIRFDDVYARVHAAAKGPTLAVLLVAIGAGLTIRTAQAVVAALLVVVLQFVAGPVGAHLLGRSIYRVLRPELDGPDQLAEEEDDEDGAGAADRPGSSSDGQ